jgi:hypothetical protein
MSLIILEIERFQRKGLKWTLICIIQSILFTYPVIWFGDNYWPRILMWLDKNQIAHWKFNFVVTYSAGFGSLVFFNLLFALLYWLEIPWVEKHKI